MKITSFPDEGNPAQNFQMDVVPSAFLIGSFRLLPLSDWSFGKDWLLRHRMVARVSPFGGIFIVVYKFYFVFLVLISLSKFVSSLCLVWNIQRWIWELSMVFKQSNNWTSVFYDARGRSTRFLQCTELAETAMYLVWLIWLSKEIGWQFFAPLMLMIRS